MNIAARCLGVVAVLLSVGCGGSPEPIAPDVGVDDIGEVDSALSTRVSNFGSNPGELGMRYFVPASLAANAPLVVALHGCTMTAAGYESAGWNELAERFGFAVLYPEQPRLLSNRCFTWYGDASSARDAAEVRSIVQMVDWMKKEFAVDPSRVFVSGLSAGGAMTAVLAATHPDVFSAGAVMAGVPFGCASSLMFASLCMSTTINRLPSTWGDLVRSASRAAPAGTKPARMSIWHGNVDVVVNPLNLAELAQQWTDVHGLVPLATDRETVGRAIHSNFRDAAGNVLVDTWLVGAMGHAVSVDAGAGCGSSGLYFSDTGVCSTLEAARFFGITK